MASRPKFWPRPQRFGLGLESFARPRPQTFGLDLVILLCNQAFSGKNSVKLGILLIFPAIIKNRMLLIIWYFFHNYFWPRPSPQPPEIGLGLVAVASASIFWPRLTSLVRGHPRSSLITWFNRRLSTVSSDLFAEIAAPPPFRPGNPALCGSYPLVAPYYCCLLYTSDAADE